MPGRTAWTEPPEDKRRASYHFDKRKKNQELEEKQRLYGRLWRLVLAALSGTEKFREHHLQEHLEKIEQEREEKEREKESLALKAREEQDRQAAASLVREREKAAAAEAKVRNLADLALKKKENDENERRQRVASWEREAQEALAARQHKKEEAHRKKEEKAFAKAIRDRAKVEANRLRAEQASRSPGPEHKKEQQAPGRRATNSVGRTPKHKDVSVCCCSAYPSPTIH